jgi:hypothetical protein
MGEIRPDDSGFSSMGQSESKITCSTTEIENEGIGVAKDGSQKFCGAGTPKAIELQRKKVVEQIVARGDLREHFTDFVGSIGFSGRTFGARSLHRCGSLSHGFLAKAFRSP